jgi:hypothetical protein
MATIRYQCATCGEMHEGIPDIGFDAPLYYHQIPEDERDSTAKLSDDFCSINDEDFFVRTCLRIPIRGHEEDFMWGVWVSLSRENFDRYRKIFNDEPPEGEGPYFGWFSNRIEGYPETLNLKTRVHLQRGGARPLLELEPIDHPLAVHHREGIELEELLRLIDDRLHP